MKKILLLLVSSILILSACTKSDIRVQGFMKLNTGQPIQGLTVSLQNSKNHFETTTDQTGYYMFDNVPVGTWELIAGERPYLIPLETFSVIDGSSGNIYQKNFTFVLIKP